MALVLHSSEIGAQPTSQQEQLESIREFVDSLTFELHRVEGVPSKALIREILAPSLRITVDLGEEEVKRDFLNALQSNIHKFALQEQQSLARFWSIQISSEYRNLASFVEAFPDFSGQSSSSSGATGVRDGPLGHSTLDRLRRELKALPEESTAASTELATRILGRELREVLETADKRTKLGFLIDLRGQLYKFPEAAQKEILEKVPGLQAEVHRLVETMSQELSIWLDEERIISREERSVGPLMEKGRALFEAILRPAFRALFLLLGVSERKGKEVFLLKLSLVLSVCPRVAERAGLDEIVAQCKSLRYQYFYVTEMGDLMDDWLQTRVSDLNDEFKKRATAVLESNPHPVLLKLRRLFRAGRVVCYEDQDLEDELFNLFLDRDFPRHILSREAITEVLAKVANQGGPTCNFTVHEKSSAPQPEPTASPPALGPPGSPLDPWAIGQAPGGPEPLGSSLPPSLPFPTPMPMSQPAPISQQSEALSTARPKFMAAPMPMMTGPDPTQLPAPTFPSVPPIFQQQQQHQQQQQQQQPRPPPALGMSMPMPMSMPMAQPGAMFPGLQPMSQPAGMLQPGLAPHTFPGLPLLPQHSPGLPMASMKFGLDDDEI